MMTTALRLEPGFSFEYRGCMITLTKVGRSTVRGTKVGACHHNVFDVSHRAVRNWYERSKDPSRRYTVTGGEGRYGIVRDGRKIKVIEGIGDGSDLAHLKADEVRWAWDLMRLTATPAASEVRNPKS